MSKVDTSAGPPRDFSTSLLSYWFADATVWLSWAHHNTSFAKSVFFDWGNITQLDHAVSPRMGVPVESL